MRTGFVLLKIVHAFGKSAAVLFGLPPNAAGPVDAPFRAAYIMKRFNHLESVARADGAEIDDQFA
jgi:hypothetical protein